MAGVCLSSPKATWDMRSATLLHRLVLDRMSKPAIRYKLSLHCCAFTPCEPNMHHRCSQVWCYFEPGQAFIWSLMFLKVFWTLVKQTSPLCVDDVLSLSHTWCQWWRWKSSGDFENIIDKCSFNSLCERWMLFCTSTFLLLGVTGQAFRQETPAVQRGIIPTPNGWHLHNLQ